MTAYKAIEEIAVGDVADGGGWPLTVVKIQKDTVDKARTLLVYENVDGDKSELPWSPGNLVRMWEGD